MFVVHYGSHTYAGNWIAWAVCYRDGKRGSSSHGYICRDQEHGLRIAREKAEEFARLSACRGEPVALIEKDGSHLIG